MVTVVDYLDLVPSANQKPRFLASLEAVLAGPVDAATLAQGVRVLFDLDTAIGAQLDAIGLWIGTSRYLTTALAGVYFSFDTATLGFDEGTWQGAYDPTTGLTILPDDAYRSLLRATAMANDWDGTIPGIYAILRTLFGRPDPAEITNGQDMTMTITLTFTPDPITAALLTTALVDKITPAGVSTTVIIP